MPAPDRQRLISNHQVRTPSRSAVKTCRSSTARHRSTRCGGRRFSRIYRCLVVVRPSRRAPNRSSSVTTGSCPASFAEYTRQAISKMRHELGPIWSKGLFSLLWPIYLPGRIVKRRLASSRGLVLTKRGCPARCMARKNQEPANAEGGRPVGVDRLRWQCREHAFVPRCPQYRGYDPPTNRPSPDQPL